MSMRIYWPKTGIKTDHGFVLGLTVRDVIVVVGIVEEWMNERACQCPNLSVVGTAVPSSSALAPAQSLQFELKRGIPIKTFPATQIILFDPPDSRRLRYLSTSSRKVEKGDDSSYLAGQDGYGIGSRRKQAVGLESIVPLLNDVRRIQRRLDSVQGGGQACPSSTDKLDLARFPTIFAPLTHMLQFLAWSAHAVLPETTSSTVGQYSSAINQLGLRSRQILSGPAEFRETLHNPSIHLQARSKRYIRFWNTVWLILNDLVLGYVAGELLRQFGPMLCSYLPRVFQIYGVDQVTSALEWLDDWPVGLKLNTPLSRFFRIAFSAIVAWWGVTIHPFLKAHLSTWFQIITWSGYGGLTLFLALTRDTLALLTLHLRICHKITSLLVGWQMSSLGGLWNLFRGKKWNVLRQRTDSYAYDVDQLFLGTLLFTVSAFLLPTVLTYAALFASIRAGLWMVDKVLEVVTNGLNAFPLFEVLLRIKEPSRLPHGLVLKLRPMYGGTSVLELQNAPKPLMSILGFNRLKEDA